MSEQVFLRGKNLTPAVRSLVPLVIIAAVVSALALHAVLYGPAIQERAERLQADRSIRKTERFARSLGSLTAASGLQPVQMSCRKLDDRS